MPLMVVGADTASGAELLDVLDPRAREIRAFVSDPDRGLELKDRGFKVATGDLSDESHVEAATTRCFSVVLIAEAAYDERERSFADTPRDVLDGWANAVSNSLVKRVIWITEDDPPQVTTAEVAVVSPTDPEFVKRVVELDEVASLS